MEVHLQGKFNDGLMVFERRSDTQALVTIGNNDDSYYSYSYLVDATPEELKVIQELALKISQTNPHS